MAGLFLLTGVLTYGSYLVLSEVDEQLRILDNIKREWDTFFSPDESSSSGNAKEVKPGAAPDAGGPGGAGAPAPPPPPPPPTNPPPLTTKKRVLRKRKKGEKQKQPRKKYKPEHLGISETHRGRHVSDDYDMPKRKVRFKIEDDYDNVESMETGFKRRRAAYESKGSKKKHGRAKNNNWDSKRGTRILKHKKNNMQLKVKAANEFIESNKKLKKRQNFKSPVRKVTRKEFGTSKSTQLERKRNQKAGIRRKNTNNNKRIKPKKVQIDEDD